MDTPPTPPSQSTKSGCGSALIVLFLGLMVYVMFIQDDSPTKAPLPVAQTTSQWMEKARQLGSNRLMFQSGQIMCGRDELYGAVGKPRVADPWGEEMDMVWQCSDGSVSVHAKLIPLNYQGMIIGTIASRQR